MAFRIDLTELEVFGRDLVAFADQIEDKAKPVVEESAQAVSEVMKADMGASGHFGQVADAISYDLRRGGLEAEIGPSKGSPGSLANIAYFGGANGGGGTVRDPQEALNEVAPVFVQSLADLISELL